VFVHAMLDRAVTFASEWQMIFGAIWQVSCGASLGTYSGDDHPAAPLAAADRPGGTQPGGPAMVFPANSASRTFVWGRLPEQAD
jgi:hypothetical protein